jgi:uncharacterized membrane protein YhiD involved in acid resistance
LALSLGLVGALSIVRFRAAIKEPEELNYLFLCIAIGLGLGAGQRAITCISFLFVVSFIYFGKSLSKGKDDFNLHLIVSADKPQGDELENIMSILKQNCTMVNLRRIDEQEEIFEVTFLIETKDFESFAKVKASLNNISNVKSISFLDSKGTV